MEERVRELEERLAAMERRLGWWRGGGLAVLALAVAVGVWSCGQVGISDVVKAERFELTGSDGQLHGIWEFTSSEGTKLDLFDESIGARTRISLSPTGVSNISLASGRQQLRLGADGNGVAAAYVILETAENEDNGHPMINLMLGADGSVGLGGANKHGLISLGVAQAGEAYAWVRGNGGAADIAIDQAGSPRFVLSKQYSKETIFSIPGKQ